MHFFCTSGTAPDMKLGRIPYSVTTDSFNSVCWRSCELCDLFAVELAGTFRFTFVKDLYLTNVFHNLFILEIYHEILLLMTYPRIHFDIITEQ